MSATNIHQASSILTGGEDLEEIMLRRVYVLSDILDTVWIVIVAIMIILAQVGFVMKE